MEEGPLWLTIVAVAVAAYGALLSTLLAIYQARRDRRRLRITAGSLLILESDPEAIYEVLWVRAVNDGHRPIQADDPDAVQRFTGSEADVSRWFVEKMKEVHGIDVSQPPPPVKKVHDVQI